MAFTVLDNGMGSRAAGGAPAIESRLWPSFTKTSEPTTVGTEHVLASGQAAGKARPAGADVFTTKLGTGAAATIEKGPTSANAGRGVAMRCARHLEGHGEGGNMGDGREGEAKPGAASQMASTIIAWFTT